MQSQRMTKNPLFLKQSPRHLRKAGDGKSPRQTTNQGNTKKQKIKLDENDIRNIHDAIKGWKTNQEPLTKILTEKNNQQRQNLQVQYKDKYGKVRNLYPSNFVDVRKFS